MVAEDSANIQSIDILWNTTLKEPLKGFPFPDITTLERLSNVCVGNEREYGVQLYSIKDGLNGTEKAVYSQGKDLISGNLINRKMQIKGFLSIPIQTEAQNNSRLKLIAKDIPWFFHPSDYGVAKTLDWPGDILATNFSKRIAGYLNISSPYGSTMHIGPYPLDDLDKSLTDTQWTVIKGTLAGRSLTYKDMEKDRSIKPDGLMLLSHVYPGSTSSIKRYFLSIS